MRLLTQDEFELLPPNEQEQYVNETLKPFNMESSNNEDGYLKNGIEWIPNKRLNPIPGYML